MDSEIRGGLFNRKNGNKTHKAIIQTVTADWTYVRRGG